MNDTCCEKQNTITLLRGCFMGMNDVFRELNEQAECRGIFVANCVPSIWWYLIIGPLASIRMKQYIISLFDEAIHFTRLDMWGKVLHTDELKYEDITTHSLRDGMISKKWKISINDNKMKLLVPFRKKDSLKFMDSPTYEFLKHRVDTCR
jgi:hypothetical protein